MNLSRIPLLVWFLIPTIVILGAGVWFFSRPSVLGEKGMAEGSDLSIVPVSNPVEGTADYEIIGRQHIASGTPGSGYNSNPPTSGVHWQGPAKNGVYGSPLPDEQAIHNLEHGYVWISYWPKSVSLQATEGAAPKEGLSDEDLNKIVEIVKDDDWKIILSPREANDKKIALAAWGRVLNLDTFDPDKIKDFVKTYRNRGPEKTPE